MQSWNDVLQNCEPFFISQDKSTSVFYLCETFDTPYPVIIKRVSSQTQAQASEVAATAASLHAISSPHVVSCLQHWQERSPSGEFLNFIRIPIFDSTLAHDLQKLKSANPLAPHSEADVETYLNQLVSAYSTLQDHGLPPRFITPYNIVFDQQNQIQVYEFGYCDHMYLSDWQVASSLAENPYFSPELRQKLLITGNDWTLATEEMDLYRCGVFSLGVIILYLLTMQFPHGLSTLEDVPECIEERLQYVRDTYGEKWRRILGMLLTVSGSERKDFVQLKNWLSCPEDEKITPTQRGDEESPLKMRMVCGQSQLRVSSSRSEEVPCIVSLEAITHDNSFRMYSCDFVCLIDVSGSMREMRLSMVQDALKEWVTRLEPNDRMGLVTFSDWAKYECGLIACTEAGKERLMTCIDLFQYGDLTNISKGLEAAMDLIAYRQCKNSAVTMLVFTDGKQSVGELSFDDCRRIMRRNMDKNLSVFVLGLGEDLDTKLLELIARRGHGMFIHIPTPDGIPEAFGMAFTKSTSVVAWNITVSLKLNGSEEDLHCKIKQKYVKENEEEYHVPAIMANSKKDFVFILATVCNNLQKPTSMSPVSAVAQFEDNANVDSRLEATFSVRIIPWVDSNPPKVAEVIANWYRVKGASALTEASRLAENSRFPEAGKTLENCIESLSSDDLRNDSMVKEMIEDLKKMLVSVRNKYNWKKGGESQFASMSYKHYTQSATQPRSVYASPQERPRSRELGQFHSSEEAKSSYS